jgi:hypothetical protein
MYCFGACDLLIHKDGSGYVNDKSTSFTKGEFNKGVKNFKCNALEIYLIVKKN